MSRIFDLSIPVVHGLPVWAGDPPTLLERVESRSSGAAYTLSRLSLSVHAGTHVDAPAHMLDGPGVEVLPLSVLVGRCYLWEAPGDGPLDAALLAQLPEAVERVLIRTGLAPWWEGTSPALPSAFRGLTLEGAQLLLDRDVKLIGVDTPSVEQPGANDHFPVHHLLLAQGVVIVESLDLAEAPVGTYQLCCLPLRLAGADGAPARVIVWKDP